MITRLYKFSWDRSITQCVKRDSKYKIDAATTSIKFHMSFSKPWVTVVYPTQFYFLQSVQLTVLQLCSHEHNILRSNMLSYYSKRLWSQLHCGLPRKLF